MKFSYQLKRKQKKGFTLLEVMITLAMLVLLLTSIFLMVQTTGSLTTRLEYALNREQEVARLIELSRFAFRSMPSSCRLEGLISQERGGASPRVIFHNASSLFTMGSTTLQGDYVVLAAEPVRGGMYQISLQSYDIPATGGQDVAGAKVILIEDLLAVSFRYYDPRTRQWKEDWNDRTIRPSMIEMKMTLAETNLPQENIFWLPPIRPPLL